MGRTIGRAEPPPQDMVDDPYVSIRRSEYERLMSDARKWKLYSVPLPVLLDAVPKRFFEEVASTVIAQSIGHRCPDTGEPFCTCSAHGEKK